MGSTVRQSQLEGVIENCFKTSFPSWSRQTNRIFSSKFEIVNTDVKRVRVNTIFASEARSIELISHQCCIAVSEMRHICIPLDPLWKGWLGKHDTTKHKQGLYDKSETDGIRRMSTDHIPQHACNSSQGRVLNDHSCQYTCQKKCTQPHILMSSCMRALPIDAEICAHNCIMATQYMKLLKWSFKFVIQYITSVTIKINTTTSKELCYEALNILFTLLKSGTSIIVFAQKKANGWYKPAEYWKDGKQTVQWEATHTSRKNSLLSSWKVLTAAMPGRTEARNCIQNIEQTIFMVRKCANMYHQTEHQSHTTNSWGLIIAESEEKLRGL